MDTKCKYCSSSSFISLSTTASYSGIEIGLNRKGIMRVRSCSDKALFNAEDVIVINYCPMCGRKFNK